VQLGLFSPQVPEPMRFDVTLARIRAIVGEECVGSPVLKDSNQPDSFRIESFTVSSGATSQIKITRTTSAMRQLRPLESVTVTLSNKRPISLFFRNKRYNVEHAYGPWSSGSDWWNSTSWNLEQWDLVARSHTDGLLLCCRLARDLSQSNYQMVALYD
jgi:protein ImuB